MLLKKGKLHSNGNTKLELIICWKKKSLCLSKWFLLTHYTMTLFLVFQSFCVSFYLSFFVLNSLRFHGKSLRLFKNRTVTPGSIYSPVTVKVSLTQLLSLDFIWRHNLDVEPLYMLTWKKYFFRESVLRNSKTWSNKIYQPT